MSYPWSDFRAALLRSSSTLPFQRQFETIRAQWPDLLRFRDSAHLLDYLRHAADTADRKNAMLSSLVRAAQGSAGSSDCALTLMLLALWPGLDGVYHRMGRRHLMPHHELAAEVVATAIAQIRTLDLTRVRWIAATILKNIERDIVRAHWREIGQQRQQLALDEVPTAIIATTVPGRSREHLHDEIVGLIGRDGVIVMRVAVDGFQQAEAAAELGLSPAAARKRYQRATGRLRTILQDCR